MTRNLKTLMSLVQSKRHPTSICAMCDITPTMLQDALCRAAGVPAPEHTVAHSTWRWILHFTLYGSFGLPRLSVDSQ